MLSRRVPGSVRSELPDPVAQPTMTIPEAARLLRISKSCAYEAAKRGHLPIIQMAGRRLVPTATLLGMLGFDGAQLTRLPMAVDARAPALSRPTRQPDAQG